ncbi:polysialyltransferase family glycosyltransferase [Serratia fonticola]|uniref:polysialyltransferase family glycosyltransferase n=1 Tax=Serratia fonticola TaxID=47917 RepID=UPI003BB6F490
MKANFFVIESPLQACSAIKVGNTIDGLNWFLVRLNGEVKNDQLIKEAFHGSRFHGNVFFFKCKKGNKINIISLIVKCYFFCISKHPVNNRIFIGHWHSIWMRVLAYLLNARNVNVLDDGLATLDALNRLESSLNKPSFHKIKMLLYPTFYSSFADESTYQKLFKLARNEKKTGKRDDEFAIIIGSPLVEKGILTESNYNIYFENMISYASEHYNTILYIPHRAEYMYEKKLGSISSITIKNIDVSIEQYIYKLNILPGAVISFYSTALVNISNEYDDIKCISIVIKLDDINSKFKDRVNEAYVYFSKNNKIEMMEI